MCYHSSQFGGVEKHILDIISGLSKEFDFLVACPEGPLVEEYLNAGAKKHYNIYPKFEADFSYSLKIRNIIKREKVSVVHSHELLTGSLATFGAWLAGADKRIYHVHTSFTQWRYSNAKKYFALLINTFVNFIVANFFATDVIALTESVKNIRQSKEFVSSGKIRVIPNGIYLDQFTQNQLQSQEYRDSLGISEGAFVIGNIARFTEEKGHRVLIDAFSMLIKENREKDFALILAGSGTLQNEMQLKVEELQLQSKVHFVGNFTETDKNKLLNSFDCFVFPSYAEGFGIALVEAMAVGVPVVASNLDVLKDVGQDAAVYFEVGDSIDLKNKLHNLADDSDQYKKLRGVGLDQSKNFSIQKFWQAYSRLYTLK